MAIITDNTPSFGARLGESVGKGLNELIGSKIADLQRKKSQTERKEAYKKAKLPEWLAELPEDKQELFLKEFDFLQPEQKEQIADALSSVDPNNVEPFQPQQQEAQQPQQQQQNQIMPHTQQPHWGVKPLRDTPMGQENIPFVQQPAEDIGPRESKISGLESLASAGKGAPQEATAESQTQAFPREGRGAQGQPAPTESYENPDEQISMVRKRTSRGRMSAAQQQTQDYREKREARLEREHAHKVTQKYVNSVLGMDKAKNEEDVVLRRIIKTTEEEGGKIRPGQFTELLRTIGLDYAGFKNDPTLEIEKLAKWFLRGGTKLFGGKVSNAEMWALLSQVPNEIQTNSGRVRLAKLMEIANKNYHDEARITRRLIEENGGFAPLNIEYLVSKEMEPINERNAQEFINYGYEKPQFKVGGKVSDTSKLPDGAIVKQGGKRYKIQNGKRVEIK